MGERLAKRCKDAPTKIMVGIKSLSARYSVEHSVLGLWLGLDKEAKWGYHTNGAYTATLDTRTMDIVHTTNHLGTHYVQGNVPTETCSPSHLGHVDRLGLAGSAGCNGAFCILFVFTQNKGPKVIVRSYPCPVYDERVGEPFGVHPW